MPHIRCLIRLPRFVRDDLSELLHRSPFNQFRVMLSENRLPRRFRISLLWPQSRRLAQLTLIAILLMALILRLSAFKSLADTKGGFLTGDGLFYHLLAKSILKGQYLISSNDLEEDANIGSFYQSKGVRYFFKTAIIDKPTNYWSPGYPAFLASCYALFGVKPWIPALLGCFIGVFGCYLLYVLCRQIAPLDIGVGLMAALGLAIHPNAIRYSPRLETDIPALVLFLLISYLILRLRNHSDQYSIGRMFALGVLLAVLFLVRSTYVLLLVAFLLSFLLRPGRRNRLLASTLLITFILCLLPWGFRNQRALGRFMLFDDRGVNVLYGELSSKSRFAQRFSEIKGTSEIERVEEQKAFLFELLKSDPIVLLRSIKINSVFVFFPFGKYKARMIVFDLIILLGTIWGVFLLRSSWYRLLPFLLFVFFYMATVLLLIKGYEFRFRLPVEVLAMIFLSTAIMKTRRYISSLRRSFIKLRLRDLERENPR